MKKITFAISVLIFALSACNMSSGTPTVVATDIAETVSPTLAPATVVTSSPEVQTPVSTPLAAEQSNTIRFEAGGTWMDLPDSVNSGMSKTYTLNAMEGQIMSVSVRSGDGTGEWGFFPLEIKGNDGVILCPAVVNTDCDFWRGALPSTQDYFITVKPGGSLTDFTLRVAINPPGKAEQFFQYENPATGLSITYSDPFAPAVFPSFANTKTNTELVLQFVDSTFYDKTNLSEVYFLLGSSADPLMVATCTDPNESGGVPEELKGNEMFNGYAFAHSQAAGAGAGNIYEQEIYRVALNNICYEAIYFIHYSNIGNYPAGAVTEFDRNTLMKKLGSILSTFEIK